ncbi:hypothetical protein K438DRAFT_2046134 [Mycena galopus ATCC 62051]|nr:hypothetical protein K438DRAFT_2046134 [Mycena galopus ATCC 62051]
MARLWGELVMYYGQSQLQRPVMPNLGNQESIDIFPQPPLCIHNQMRSLNLSTTGDLPFIGFFDSLAFPRLESLTLNTFVVPGVSLLELHGRSQSQIQHLALESPRLTADEIIQLLRIMPSLQMFSLAYSHYAGNIFAALTYRGDPTAAPLVLPNLERLAVAENAVHMSWTDHPAADDGTDGIAVVEMAESLQRYPGPQNGQVPSLRSVELYLAGPKFAPALEARLAAPHVVAFQSSRSRYDSHFVPIIVVEFSCPHSPPATVSITNNRKV